MSIEIIESHSVLPDIISPGSIVVDCGANVERFSLEMIKPFGCSCYAIEAAPDTFSRAVLEQVPEQYGCSSS